MTTEKSGFTVWFRAFGGKMDSRTFPSMERAEQWARQCGIFDKPTTRIVPPGESIHSFTCKHGVEGGADTGHCWQCIGELADDHGHYEPDSDDEDRH